MGNKKFIWTITSVVGLLCLFYLAFTFLSRSVQNKAALYATNEKGEVDLKQQQAYLDSAWEKPVFNFLGMEFTYQEIKEKELKLGFDLQGGMQAVLEVSPSDLLIALSGNNQTPAFRDALRNSEVVSKSQEKEFLGAFSESYQECHKDCKLAELFATSSNFFGGEVLRGFSFSLLVGEIFGIYSSIFIAAPIVLDFYSGTVRKPLGNAHDKKLATA